MKNKTRKEKKNARKKQQLTLTHRVHILTLRNENHPVNKTRFLVAFDSFVCECMSMFMTLNMPEQRFMLCSQQQQQQQPASALAERYDLATLNADNKSITQKI